MTRRIIFIAALALLSAPVFAQYTTFSPEELIRFTPKNTYERFDDGRPRVPDSILERMKEVSIEEAWGVLRRHGFNNQFEGDWMNLHPDRILVGRALTASFIPKRPDLDDVTNEIGKERKDVGGQNSWVIDRLQENDVIVIDLFGKVEDGTFAGDNLANAIAAKTHAGMVINGGVRDLDGIFELPNFCTFVKGVHPTAIANVTLLGVNTPVKIGAAVVMPGDVVLGRPEGVIFIPPHFAEEVCSSSENIRLRDEFGHLRLQQGKYTPGEIDRKWSDEIEKDFEQWKQEREKK
ncbi:MAG: RraA family protein [bacterium]|nr:RraA family protein [bacterium]